MEPDHPRVLGVLAGADMPLEQLAAWARSAEVVLAADAGADRLLEAGVPPATTVGDLDSIKSLISLRRVIRDPDQETSDCDKLLALAERIGHREITITGAEGDRLDHVLGTFASVARSRLRVRLALRRGLAWVLRGPCEHTVSGMQDDILSFMPIERCRGVHLKGVEWPLEGEELAPQLRVSLSNRPCAGTVSVSVESGVGVLFSLAPRLESPTW